MRFSVVKAHIEPSYKELVARNDIRPHTFEYSLPASPLAGFPTLLVGIQTACLLSLLLWPVSSPAFAVRRWSLLPFLRCGKGRGSSP